MLKVEGMRLLNGARVSCELTKGTLKVLQGPNGVGKSLLLRSLALLHPAPFESYSFDGMDASSIAPKKLRSQLLYIPPVPLETAGTVADYFMAPWQLAIRKGLTPSDKWVEILKQEDLWERSVGLLSSGEKQFTQLIRAFSLGPKVYLLDEAMGHMDHTRRSMTEAFLQEQIEAGAAALIVTHEDKAVQRLNAEIVRFGSRF